ncbi:MAG: N-acetylmuramoyl-L-alanine amidase [Phycisphaerales bacterium]|jgi:N-acetyl-anhydromuramyl-L-alanine amidase AmpD|nr:N-acetylmuramoyl-L-alanine amidase [Phycisphaerales bacterium]
MSRGRKSKSSPARSRWLPVAWLIAFSALVAAGVFGWRHEKHAPNVVLYQEPGWTPAAKSDRWKCIVIHHSASEEGGAERFDEWHRKKGWDELGYHFVIGNGSDTGDGQVEVGPRWGKQKWGAHCKTDDEYYNQHGIGICLVGNFNNHPPDAKQMQSLARLVAFLSREFQIPPSRIYTHGGVTGKTECPGKQFNLELLKDRVNAK